MCKQLNFLKRNNNEGRGGDLDMGAGSEVEVA